MNFSSEEFGDVIQNEFSPGRSRKTIAKIYDIPNSSSGKESACQAGASGNEGLIPGQCYMWLDNLGARLPAF